MTLKRLIAVATFVCLPSLAMAQDAFFDIAIPELPLLEGKLPEPGNAAQSTQEPHTYFEAFDYLPRVVLDGPGEAFVPSQRNNESFWVSGWARPADGRLVAKVPKGQELSGTLYWVTADGSALIPLKFKVPAAKADAKAAANFWDARRRYYERLASRQYPGGSWFRLQAIKSAYLKTLKPGTPIAPQMLGQAYDPCGLAAQQQYFGSEGWNESIDFFTGTQALADNMRLNDIACPFDETNQWVSLSEVSGVTVAPVDWKSQMPFSPPRVEKLAMWIPSDNYALLFPSFEAMTQLMDEADAYGTPLLPGLSGISQDAGTKNRYETQLCLQVSWAARQLGPEVVKSMAFTGADPFLMSGSDVTVIFDARNADTLENYLKARHALSQKDHPEAIAETGALWGVPWTGLRTPDRTISSYVARFQDVVLVSNSLVALERSISAASGRIEPLLFTEEYLFFRERYPVSEAETALLLVTDAALRKWSGPAWRIADSRRARMAAVLSAAAAQFADSAVTGVWPASALPTKGRKPVRPPKPAAKPAANAAASTDQPVDPSKVCYPMATTVPEASLFWVSPESLRSERYGSIGFMTPIVELAPLSATQAEARAYDGFRQRYEGTWRGYFDPIAVSFSISEKRMGADLSIFPLVATSEYQDIAQLTGNNQLSDRTEYPEESMAVMGLSLNPESRWVKELNSFLGVMIPSVGRTGISWLGKWMRVYAGDDPFWAELAEVQDERGVEQFFEREFYRLPVVLEVALASPMGMATFLTSVRAFAESTAPGLVTWESATHSDHPYVIVRTSEKNMGGIAMDKLAIYYTTANNVFIITLNEALLKKALDRHLGKTAAPVATSQEDMNGLHFLGNSFGFAVHYRFLEMLNSLAKKEVSQWERSTAFRALPILNEWKRLFPDKDPVEWHKKLFGLTLLAPANGKYVWNAQYQSVESTVHGLPGQQKDGPGPLRPPMDSVSTGNFGLTFELDGLRARFEVARQARPATP